MVIILTLYLSGVYLVFFKWKLLPFNKITGGITVVLGMVILTVFLVGLQTLTPPSVQALTTGTVTEIAPQVQGRVVEVPVTANAEVEPGDLLFRIDPAPYQYRVDQLTAQLVESEAYVAQLKESYDAARAQTKATQKQLALSELRLRQYSELLSTGAGSQFDVERYETEVATLKDQEAANVAQENQALLSLQAQVGDTQTRVAQTLAQLESAQYDLESCTVEAPAAGVVALNSLVLRPGMVVSPSRSVMAFVYTDRVAVATLVAQKSLENIKVGDKAMMSFSALPGRLFEGKVTSIAEAIGNAQMSASGQLETITVNRMTKLYPILVSLPEDFPPEHRRLGLAADVRIYSENAGVVGIVAMILQWIGTSMDYVV
jgi:multidrug resistance efflux pump